MRAAEPTRRRTSHSARSRDVANAAPHAGSEGHRRRRPWTDALATARSPRTGPAARVSPGPGRTRSHTRAGLRRLSTTRTVPPAWQALRRVGQRIVDPEAVPCMPPGRFAQKNLASHGRRTAAVAVVNPCAPRVAEIQAARDELRREEG
eukprot:scaffold35841_cov46-Phaeocystis_antarctica.AAC.4